MRQNANNRRARGGRNPRKPHVPLKNQTFESNGGEVRIRGNAFQVLERYLSLARDAASAGDRVAAENYLQHAEHYHRIIHATDEGSPQRFRSHREASGDGWADSANPGEGAAEADWKDSGGRAMGTSPMPVANGREFNGHGADPVNGQTYDPEKTGSTAPEPQIQAPLLPASESDEQNQAAGRTGRRRWQDRRPGARGGRPASRPAKPTSPKLLPGDAGQES